MKINENILSIPPHISTSWKNIKAIHMKGSLLLVTLIDGETISVPELTPEVIETVFVSHAKYLEDEVSMDSFSNSHGATEHLFSQIASESSEADSPFRLGINNIEGITAAMQHNPAQANAPDLPSEMLTKIISIAKIVSPDETMGIPKAEPHCNCFHCQIARAIHQGLEEEHQDLRTNSTEGEEEEVADEELTFCQWEINQSGNKLYTVVNRLDTKEKYNVYLGNPVGCTCGKEGCEHILAVLKS